MKYFWFFGSLAWFVYGVYVELSTQVGRGGGYFIAIAALWYAFYVNEKVNKKEIK